MWPSQVLTFAAILLLMKKDYRGTFFSTMKGKEMTMDLFFSEDEAIKSTVISYNKNHWRGIRSLLREWTHRRWGTWKIEKPSWYTERWISKIPENWIPRDERRRGSVFATINEVYVRQRIEQGGDARAQRAYLFYWRLAWFPPINLRGHIPLTRARASKSPDLSTPMKARR